MKIKCIIERKQDIDREIQILKEELNNKKNKLMSDFNKTYGDMIFKYKNKYYTNLEIRYDEYTYDAYYVLYEILDVNGKINKNGTFLRLYGLSRDCTMVSKNDIFYKSFIFKEDINY